MVRFFWVSLTLVVILVGVLVWRGGVGPLPESGRGLAWPQWLVREDLTPLAESLARLETHISTLEKEVLVQRSRIEELSQRLAARDQGQDALESGSVTARQEDKEWKLANLFSRVREYRQRVEFARAFSVTPRVVLGIVGLDVNLEKIHFQASAEEIDAKGFTLLLMTRAEERPREVRVEWLAYGR
ncbi:MAG: hypothetical protein G8237_13195 [Magnetococcales bacterium]|nr:H-type lectin domain-containing protein [Magnetococcales bacterium]NGZ07300.1 hypothetical protein [Magnetococcales bacterium]